MSLQDDIFDIGAVIETHPKEIQEAWERFYTHSFLAEEERDHTKKQVETLMQALRIIKNWSKAIK